MKKDRSFILGSSVILVTIFTLVFLSIEFNSAYLVMAACLAIVILFFMLLTSYIKAEYTKTISQMTHELIDIVNNLDERDYSNLSSDAKAYYRALSMVKQTFNQRETTRKEILEIAHYVGLNMEFDKTLHELLPKLAELTKSNCCAFYSVNNGTKLSIKHSVGFGKNIYSEFDLSIGEGFIGQIAGNSEITIVHEVPDDTIYMVRTFLGKIKPRNIMVVPIFHQEQLNGVLVCASINSYSEDSLQLAEMLKYYLGVAVGNGMNAERNKRLANELAFQNKLIQNQHEEMRKRLSDKELLVNHLINIIDDNIVYVLDANYKVLYWDESAKGIYGLGKEETVGRHIDKVHGELGWGLIDGILREMGEDGAEHCTWVTGQDGSRRRFELCFSQLAAGEDVGVVARVREV